MRASATQSFLLQPKFFVPSHKPRHRKLKWRELKLESAAGVPSFEIYSGWQKVPDSGDTVHCVVIKDKKFKPEFLNVNPGDLVEWQLHNDSQSSESQLYWEKSRAHVIST